MLPGCCFRLANIGANHGGDTDGAGHKWLLLADHIAAALASLSTTDQPQCVVHLTIMFPSDVSTGQASCYTIIAQLLC